MNRMIYKVLGGLALFLYVVAGLVLVVGIMNLDSMPQQDNRAYSKYGDDLDEESKPQANTHGVLMIVAISSSIAFAGIMLHTLSRMGEDMFRSAQALEYLAYGDESEEEEEKDDDDEPDEGGEHGSGEKQPKN